LPRWQTVRAVPNLLVCIVDTMKGKLLASTLVYVQHILSFWSSCQVVEFDY